MGFHIPTGKDYKIEHYFQTSDFTQYVKLYELKTFRLLFVFPITYWVKIPYVTKWENKDYWEEKKAIQYIKNMPSPKWCKLEL